MDVLTGLLDGLKSTVSDIEVFVNSQKNTTQGPTLVQALANLQTLHTQLGTVDPADTQTIGTILIAVGGIIVDFFPNWASVGTALVLFGEGLSQGQGTVGPVRVGNLALTLTVGPWTGGTTEAPAASTPTQGDASPASVLPNTPTPVPAVNPQQKALDEQFPPVRRGGPGSAASAPTAPSSLSLGPRA